MAAWIACALAALIIVKPQEFVAALAGLPLLYVAFAAVVVAGAVDVVRRRVRISLAPAVPFLAAFLAWALIVTAVKRPAALGETLLGFAILAGVFGAIAIGCASAAGLRAFAITFTACAALAATVAIAQSEGPFECFLAAPEDWEGRGELTPDGRPCVSALECTREAPVPDGNYRCERRGPLGTATIGGRVRYRGSLSDPNELSLAVSVALPFAAALAARRRAAGAARARRAVPLPPLVGDRLLARCGAVIRSLPAIALYVAVAVTVVLSRSRTGLLVFLAVVGIQAVRWAGAWGVVAGCLVGPPMLLLGGRSGTEADESTDERAEILREAFELIRTHKGVGLGVGGFTDASSIGMTAHNAYILAAAEAGIVGYLLFCFAVYLSLKVPVVLWLAARSTSPARSGLDRSAKPAEHFGTTQTWQDFGRATRDEGSARDAAVARFAPAIATALAGALLGVTFLSWTYKDILFLVLGASAALWSAARAGDPGLRIRLSWREAAIVATAAMSLLAIVYVGSRLHR